MINSATIEKLCNDFDILLLEKHLIYWYLNNFSIAYEKSDFIKIYFDEFIIDDKLINRINNLGIRNLKELEKCLELIIPNNDRKLNGAFFTPDNIVQLIISKVNPQINHKNLDPSCGCGAFLIGLTEYLRANNNVSYKDIISKNIFGADILEYNVRRTKILLALLALNNNEILNDDDFNIRLMDSTKDVFNFKYDNIVGNPPYVKFQDLSLESRDYLYSKFSSINKGTYNLYFAFFELSYNLLNENGKIGFITPNNYFTSLAGESLREYFMNNKSIYEIIDFNSKKVFDAQTYTAITFLSKSKNEFINYSRIKDDESIDSYLNSLTFSKNLYNELNSKKWRLLQDSEKNIIKNIENIGTPIGELLTINVGIATLKDEIYFLNNCIKEGDFYIKEFNGISYRIEKDLIRSVYKISDFQNQEELIDNNRKIIFPYKYINGKAEVLSENEIKTNYPEAFNYFLARKDELLARSGSSKLKEFYQWGRSQGLNKKGIKILTPTFSQYPRFLLVTDKESFFTNGYGIFINEKASNYSIDLFSETTNLLNKEENFIIVQRILNSILMHYYVVKTSVSIDGGYPCYQKNFIEKFSIPEFTEVEILNIEKLNDEELDEFLILKYKLEKEKEEIYSLKYK